MDVRMRDQQFETFLCYNHNREIFLNTQNSKTSVLEQILTNFSHQLTLLYSKHLLVILKPKPVRQADGSHHSRSLIEES